MTRRPLDVDVPCAVCGGYPEDHGLTIHGYVSSWDEADRDVENSTRNSTTRGTAAVGYVLEVAAVAAALFLGWTLPLGVGAVVVLDACLAALFGLAVWASVERHRASREVSR